MRSTSSLSKIIKYGNQYLNNCFEQLICEMCRWSRMVQSNVAEGDLASQAIWCCSRKQTLPSTSCWNVKKKMFKIYQQLK